MVDAGMTSAWVPDHMVRSPSRYKNHFGDPLIELTAIASVVGPEMQLGMNVLLGPLYGTARLNRAMASLARYTAHPVRLGLGVGWNEDDYAACRVDFHSRGKLLDQLIRDLRWMWGPRAHGPEDPAVSTEARLIVELDSLMPEITPRILVGGGRTANTRRMSDRVLRRIAASDGWLINPNAIQQDVEEDLARITALEGGVRGPSNCITSVFIHLAPDTMSSEAAQEEQRRAFLSFIGSEGQIDGINNYSILGTVSEIVEQLHQKAAWGPEEIICTMVTPSPEQFERFARMFAKALS